jgi:ribosomal-protein-alanine N-acetyltransferase
VIIRPCRPEDLSRVVLIAEQADEAPRWNPEAYRKALDPAAVPARITLVAEDSKAGVVGFLITVLIPPHAELEVIAVSKSARRQGIARHLVANLLANLKERQITGLMLEVRESNHAALALYRALGFIQTGRRSRYYSDPQEDAVLMLQSLVEA